MESFLFWMTKSRLQMKFAFLHYQFVFFYLIKKFWKFGNAVILHFFFISEFFLLLFSLTSALKTGPNGAFFVVFEKKTKNRVPEKINDDFFFIYQILKKKSFKNNVWNFGVWMVSKCPIPSHHVLWSESLFRILRL